MKNTRGTMRKKRLPTIPGPCFPHSQPPLPVHCPVGGHRSALDGQPPAAAPTAGCLVHSELILRANTLISQITGTAAPIRRTAHCHIRAAVLPVVDVHRPAPTGRVSTTAPPVPPVTASAPRPAGRRGRSRCGRAGSYLVY